MLGTQPWKKQALLKCLHFTVRKRELLPLPSITTCAHTHTLLLPKGLCESRWVKCFAMLNNRVQSMERISGIYASFLHGLLPSPRYWDDIQVFERAEDTVIYCWRLSMQLDLVFLHQTVLSHIYRQRLKFVFLRKRRQSFYLFCICKVILA